MNESIRMLLVIFGIVWGIIIGGGYLWFSAWHFVNEGTLPDYFLITAPLILIVAWLIEWVTRKEKEEPDEDENKDDFVHYY